MQIGILGDVITGLLDSATRSVEPVLASIVDSVGEDAAQRAPAITIGPITTAAARARGLEIATEATKSTIPGLVDAAELAKVLRERDQIPREAFDAAVGASARDGFSAEEYLRERTVADTSELDPVIDRILSENEQQVEAYRGGKEGLLGFFVGQVMRETQGKANPKVVNERLREKLGA